jgi:hypothetical protein
LVCDERDHRNCFAVGGAKRLLRGPNSPDREVESKNGFWFRRAISGRG